MKKTTALIVAPGRKGERSAATEAGWDAALRRQVQFAATKRRLCLFCCYSASTCLKQPKPTTLNRLSASGSHKRLSPRNDACAYSAAIRPRRASNGRSQPCSTAFRHEGWTSGLHPMGRRSPAHLVFFSQSIPTPAELDARAVAMVEKALHKLGSSKLFNGQRRQNTAAESKAFQGPKSYGRAIAQKGPKTAEKGPRTFWKRSDKSVSPLPPCGTRPRSSSLIAVGRAFRTGHREMWATPDRLTEATRIGRPQTIAGSPRKAKQ